MTRPTVIWHDLECGAYGADLAALARARGRGGPVLDVGAGTGRVTLDLARARARGRRAGRRRRLLAALRERAGGLPVETVHADARELDLERRFPLIIVPMQTLQLLGGSGGPDGVPAPRPRAPRAAAGSSRWRSPTRWRASRSASTRDAAAAGDARDRRHRLLEPRRSRSPTRATAARILRVRETVDRSARHTVAGERRTARRASIPATLEGEGRAAGSARAPARRAMPESDEYIGSTVVMLGAGARRCALRALPGPHEHLRRPRQHPAARAPLRVARDRLRRDGRGPRRRDRPGAPTTSSTSAAARTATSCSARGPRRGRSATRCTLRPPRRRASSSASAAATSCSATPTCSATRRSPASGCWTS